MLGVLVASLVVSGLVLLVNGAGSSIGDRLSSVQDPPTDDSRDREEALAAGRTFVQRFYTYDPSMLAEDGTMPAYAEVGDLMSAKFAGVFEETRQIAEYTVREEGVGQKAVVYAVGVTAIDEDSATLIVGGTTTTSYPASAKESETERVDFPPQILRAEVTLVKVEGRWLVDTLAVFGTEGPALGEEPLGEEGVPLPSESATPEGEGTDPATPAAPGETATEGAS
ncbi:hypothetical protein GCM10025786_18570 [Nocardioides caeni]